MASQSLIYAELLSNIRQISLAVSLSSPGADSSTQVSINADGTNIELRHRGEMRSLKLPGKASIGGTLLPIQKQGVQTLSWRLPLVHPSGTTPSRQVDLPEHQAAAWPATDLQIGSAVSCRQCGTQIVKNGAITSWKDLPSENWAEMMEFWHCHKPDDAHQHSHGSPSPVSGDGKKADEKSLAARGYGASSTISAQEGVGFVDLTTFLFAASDCTGLTYSRSTYDQGSADRQDSVGADATEVKSLNIFCSFCRAQVGFYNFRAAAVTLLKWQVLCRSVSGSQPGLSQCLAATLISTISRSGSSKSLIMPMSGTIRPAGFQDTSADSVIHIWVLNSSIVYSSSEAASSDIIGISAIKLLYRLIQREEADRMLEGVTCDAQEINMPWTALGQIRELLDVSNSLLPASEQVFKEWKVGLLSR